jgi:hypothetical protein
MRTVCSIQRNFLLHTIEKSESSIPSSSANRGEGMKKWGKASLTLPSPGRGKGKHIGIRKKSLPLDGGGRRWG